MTPAAAGRPVRLATGPGETTAPRRCAGPEPAAARDPPGVRDNLTGVSATVSGPTRGCSTSTSIRRACTCGCALPARCRSVARRGDRWRRIRPATGGGLLAQRLNEDGLQFGVALGAQVGQVEARIVDEFGAADGAQKSSTGSPRPSLSPGRSNRRRSGRPGMASAPDGASQRLGTSPVAK